MCYTFGYLLLGQGFPCKHLLRLRRGWLVGKEVEVTALDVEGLSSVRFPSVVASDILISKISSLDVVWDL